MAESIWLPKVNLRLSPDYFKPEVKKKGSMGGQNTEVTVRNADIYDLKPEKMYMGFLWDVPRKLQHRQYNTVEVDRFSVGPHNFWILDGIVGFSAANDLMICFDRTYRVIAARPNFFAVHWEPLSSPILEVIKMETVHAVKTPRQRPVPGTF